MGRLSILTSVTRRAVCLVGWCASQLPLAGCAVSAGQELVPCRYVARSSVDSGFEEHASCAVIGADGEVGILPEPLATALYDGGLASLWVAGRWFYVKPDGRALEVVAFDNGPDAFSEGLVRSPRAGKVAYVDRDFKELIPPRYDWGWPFADGRALVCRGCRIEQSEGEHQQCEGEHQQSEGEHQQREGEHRPVTGGSWGYIDRSGHEVVPVALSYDQALRHSAGDPR